MKKEKTTQNIYVVWQVGLHKLQRPQNSFYECFLMFLRQSQLLFIEYKSW